MWRKLNREDFIVSNPLVAKGEPFHEFTWDVYRSYEWVKEDRRYPYLRTSERNEIKTRYEPLVDTPHLFLEIARLPERLDRNEGIGQWIAKYGLLGLQKGQASPYELNIIPRRTAPRADYRMDGGPGETLERFENYVLVAHNALALYEAALSKDVERLERAWQINGSSPAERAGRRYFESEAAYAGITYTDALVEGATRATIDYVHGILANYAYPCISYRSSSSKPGTLEPLMPEQLAPALWPRNLLGAIFLQFYWLITSSGELSHCRYCDRIISYAPPMPVGKGRKARKDKEFCDSRCRQNYHYHNRIKPERQSERR